MPRGRKGKANKHRKSPKTPSSAERNKAFLQNIEFWAYRATKHDLKGITLTQIKKICSTYQIGNGYSKKKHTAIITIILDWRVKQQRSKNAVNPRRARNDKQRRKSKSKSKQKSGKGPASDKAENDDESNNDQQLNIPAMTTPVMIQSRMHRLLGPANFRLADGTEAWKTDDNQLYNADGDEVSKENAILTEDESMDDEDIQRLFHPQRFNNNKSDGNHNIVENENDDAGMDIDADVDAEIDADVDDDIDADITAPGSQSNNQKSKPKGKKRGRKRKDCKKKTDPIKFDFNIDISMLNLQQDGILARISESTLRTWLSSTGLEMVFEGALMEYLAPKLENHGIIIDQNGTTTNCRFILKPNKGPSLACFSQKINNSRIKKNDDKRNQMIRNKQYEVIQNAARFVNAIGGAGIIALIDLQAILDGKLPNVDIHIQLCFIHMNIYRS